MLILYYNIEMTLGGRVAKQQQNWYISIIRKIDELDLQNQRLISVADHMMKTSFMALPLKQAPPIISKIQEDMRASFNALVQGVREYFIVIDDKLKQIGLVMASKLLEERPRDIGNQEISKLVNRIEQLEQNLKRTAEKQSKLINIIEQLTQRNSFEDTALQKTNTVIKDPFETSNHHESSFRIFSNKESAPLHQAYPRPYSIIDTQHSQCKFPRQKSPSNFCMMERNQYSVLSIPVPKRSLRGSKQFELQSTNKMHRMSYMMKVLKN